MQLYELLIIIIPSVTDDEIQKTLDKILASIKKEAVDVIIKEKKLLGRRKFTYPINHTSEGSYVLIDFEVDTEHMHAIDRALELEDVILRHIIVKKEIKSEKQVEREARLKEEMQQARAADTRQREAKPQQKLVQKADELSDKKGREAKTDEKLDEKLDEILKREIS